MEIDLIDLAGGHTRICGFEMSLGDGTPPALLNLSPADNATDVARAEPLVITFDENVAEGSGNIVIKRAIDDSVVETIDVNSASVNVAGPLVTILPAFLPASTDCYLQIDAGAIEDASGNAYGGFADTSTWNFSVSDDFLRIDFDDNAPVTETGFESFAEGDKPSKSFGSIGITVTGEDAAIVGGFFDRGGPADAGAMTYGELYRDFVFHNSSGTLSFDITGLAPNTQYELTWYMFDSDAAAGSLANRIQPRGGSDTIGDSVDVAYVSGSPIVANDDFAYTGVWQSIDGSLEIDVIDQAGGNTEVRVCGLRIRSGPPDTTPPNVLALSPADDALDQVRAEPLVITFDEGVQKGSGNIVIKRSSNDSVIESIDVSSAAVTVASAVVTIVPSLLPAGTDCYVQIDAGAIEDVNGNAYGGIADTSSWNFSVSDDLLRIDFDDDVPETETAFASFAQADKPSKSFNGIGVTVSGEDGAVGGFFDRTGPGDAGAMTYGELYRDFVFHNSSGTLSFDITGLKANVEYEITWYMFDSTAVGNLANRVQPRGGSNTTGDSVDVAYTSGSPILSNSDFAYTGTWKSSDGSLEIDVIDQAGGDTEVRVCGLRIVEVPAPGTVIRIR